MKKIIIFVLALLLTACNNISKTPLTNVRNIDLKREKIVEISDDFNEYNKEIRVLEITDQYVYLTIHVEFKREHQFYRIDNNNNLELIYTYKYGLWDTKHFLDSDIYNDQIILSLTYPGAQKSKIMRVKDNELETIYEVDASIFNARIYNQYLYFNENIEGPKTDKQYECVSNDQIIDLETLNVKTISSDTFKYDTKTGKLKGNYSNYSINPTYASDEGFIYEKDKYVYFYNFSNDEHMKLFRNDVMSWNTGNDQCVSIQRNDILRFVVKEDEKYVDYHINNDEYNIDISYHNDDYIDDDKYYLSVDGKVPLIIFDYKQKELMLYNNEQWYKDGQFVLQNGNIYCYKELDDKIIIEKCMIQ